MKGFENKVKEQKDCFPGFTFGILVENLLEILLTPKKTDKARQNFYLYFIFELFLSNEAIAKLNLNSMVFLKKQQT